MDNPMFLEIVKADYIDGYRIELWFNNGKSKVIDFYDLLDGEVYEPLKNISNFKSFSIRFNTIEWENGADFAPEFLFNYESVKNDADKVAEPPAEYTVAVAADSAPVLNAHNKDEFPPAHTAEHLLNQTMGRMFGCERSCNMHIERKKSKINFQLNRPLTADEVAEVERRINELIAADMPVTYEFVTRDNIPEGVKLDKLPEDASETIRLVRIGDYDVCPCIGTHVKSTKEIGNFRITSTSFNEGSFRIVYKVAE